MAEAARTIEPGSWVRLHFSISLPDGMEVEQSFDNEPLELVLGEGALQEGLEHKLIGLHPGDSETFHMGPEEAFGYRDPQAVQTLSRSDFPADMPIGEGAIVGFTAPGGEEIPGTVREIRNGEVVVDFNHPLAGREIAFTVEILAVEGPARA